MRSFRSRVATRKTMPVSSRLRPGFHASATRIAYVKSSSGAVVSTVSTAISAPVFARSSSARPVIRAAVSGGMTCARSVTNPRGAGISGSAAGAARTTVARTAAMTSALCTERVDGGDDSRDVDQVRPERGAERGGVDGALSRPVAEELAERRQRPEGLFGRREHLGIGMAALDAAQAEQMAQDHHEALERLDPELLDRLGSPRRLEEERAQPEELAAGLVLALAPERRR